MPRPYQQRKRAEQQEDTRRRIVEAAVSLHGELGPARTTMSAVADRAGVQRNTLYRHFPDERALLYACSAHHVAAHPMPDTAGWEAIPDPVERCRRGLGELYAYYQDDEQMITQVVRDAEVEPLVQEVSAHHWSAPTAAIRDALIDGFRGMRGGRRRDVEAALDLALGFATWQSLVRRSGLTSAQAATLMAKAVACAASTA